MRLCGAYANQVDHKKRDPVCDDDSPENLWALCDRHHSYKTELEPLISVVRTVQEGGGEVVAGIRRFD